MEIISGIIEDFLSKNDFETGINELYMEAIKLISKFKHFEIKKYNIDFIIIPPEKNIGKKHNTFNNTVSACERKIIERGDSYKIV